MNQKLVAFWKYDGQFPFMLWGEVERITNNGDYWISNLSGAIKRKYIIVTLPILKAEILMKEITSIKNSYYKEISEVRSKHDNLLKDVMRKYLGE